MSPPETTAASFVPSDEDAIDLQFNCEVVITFWLINVLPPSVEVCIVPPCTARAICVPSDDKAIPIQYL